MSVSERKCTYIPVLSLADRHQIEWKGPELCFWFRHQHWRWFSTSVFLSLFCHICLNSDSFLICIWTPPLRQFLLTSRCYSNNRRKKQNVYTNIAFQISRLALYFGYYFRMQLHGRLSKPKCQCTLYSGTFAYLGSLMCHSLAKSAEN